MSGKFEIYPEKGGAHYRFRLKAGNGEIIATSEAYNSKASAKKGAEAVIKASDGAEIVEVEK
ncbi:MAG: DUF1508 domain-containing protein [Propionibacteriaceae bacterium]|jgi:uncharacterized protein YegP (UPF0339 family)|nr:DUF1508 domain-containing protein [Propionibacteriaceae bacterium]